MTSLVAAGAVSAAAFGGVAAATGGDANDGDATVAVATLEQAGAAMPAQFAFQQGPQTAQLGEDGERPPRRGPRNGAELAEFLGIAPEELRAQLQAGATPAEVAAANGSSGAALIAYLVGEAQERLAEAVANGELTQAEADERLVQITERVTSFVNEGPQEGERPGRRPGGGARNGSELAEFLDIAPEELRAQLQAGATPAEVAAANGSSGAALIAYLVGEAQERLAEAVANGELTQAEADERLARITERTTSFVNEGPQEGERQGPRHGGARRALGVVAEVIGIEPQALVEGIRSGQTVADVAAANGSSGQAVVDALVANAQEHVNQAIADGRITAEEGAEKLAEASERAQTFVFETPQPGERSGRPQGGFGGPGGPGGPGAVSDF